MKEIDPELIILEVKGFLKPYNEVIAAEWSEFLLRQLPFSPFTRKNSEKPIHDIQAQGDVLFQPIIQIRDGSCERLWSSDR